MLLSWSHGASLGLRFSHIAVKPQTVKLQIQVCDSEMRLRMASATIPSKLPSPATFVNLMLSHEHLRNLHDIAGIFHQAARTTAAKHTSQA
jgi:hypothetical protein